MRFGRPDRAEVQRKDAGVSGERLDRAQLSNPSGGRPALQPPLRWWAPLVWFVALATALTFVVVVLVRPPGPLDDPDPAYQRDGLLLKGPVLDREVGGIEFGGRPIVLLFVRRPPEPDLLIKWKRRVPDRADVYVVVPQLPAKELPLPTVVDPQNSLADAVDMPRPVDGGRPVGYAVVSSERVVRYGTLDAKYLDNAFEVETIVGAAR